MKRFERLLQRIGLDQLPTGVRKILIAIAGTTVLVIGVLMVFLPGPGSLVIIAGFAILATEFVWARRLAKGAREIAKGVGRTVKRTME